MTASKTDDTAKGNSSDCETNNSSTSDWKYTGGASVATVEVGPGTYIEFHALDLDAPLESRVDLYPVDAGTVNIGFEITGTSNKSDLRAGGILELSPDQAEDLADSLRECVRAAREE